MQFDFELRAQAINVSTYNKNTISNFFKYIRLSKNLFLFKNKHSDS